MGQAQQVTITPAVWGDETERWLARAEQQAGMEEIKLQVEEGASLFHVLSGDKTVGAVVMRVDRSGSGFEGVIVSAAGHLPGFDFTELVLPHLERLFIGVHSVRIHTARPGLAEKLTKAGYHALEMVFVKRIL